MSKKLYQLSSVALAAVLSTGAYAMSPSEKPSSEPKPMEQSRLQLSPEQMKERHEKMMNHMFDKADLNKDGFISKEEALKVTEEQFDLVDTNKDGKISKEEQKAFNEQFKKKHHEKRGERPPKPDDMKKIQPQ